MTLEGWVAVVAVASAFGFGALCGAALIVIRVLPMFRDYRATGEVVKAMSDQLRPHVTEGKFRRGGLREPDDTPRPGWKPEVLIQEGTVRKGGINGPPNTPRSEAPKGQGVCSALDAEWPDTVDIAEDDVT